MLPLTPKYESTYLIKIGSSLRRRDSSSRSFSIFFWVEPRTFLTSRIMVKTWAVNSVWWTKLCQNFSPLSPSSSVSVLAWRLFNTRSISQRDAWTWYRWSAEQTTKLTHYCRGHNKSEHLVLTTCLNELHPLPVRWRAFNNQLSWCSSK